LNVDKGIFELLDAFAKLQNKYSRIALLLIGNFDGDLPIRLHGIRNNPDIIITGWIEDVPKYISAADVMVLPSYREGFSMVIQQAMAMAIPVITTDIPGPSEVIENGISGLLVQPKSTESLFDAMNWTISHSKQCQMMGASGRLRCETLFSRDRMLGLTLLDREDILKSGPVDKK
jgi:glycosyltransferase involved in cell wall biosynthesis